MNNNWLVLAYQLDGNGGGQALELPALNRAVTGLHWIHLDINFPGSRQWLEQYSGLDGVVIDALMAEGTRPRVVEIDKAALVILRGVNLNDNADPEDMVSIRMYIDNNRVISTRKFKLKAVADIEERIARSQGPKTTGELLSMLAGRLCDRMDGAITDLNEQTDNVEESVIDRPDRQLRENIVDIRKQAIVFRRYLSPQRDALAKLKFSELALFNAMDKRHFQENYDRVTRYVEELDTVRERAQIVQDELTTLLTDRLNKNMYVLAVVAALFMPLGFFTGLMGINVGGLPGVDNPLAFWEFSLLLVVLVTVQILVFKWRKWF